MNASTPSLTSSVRRFVAPPALAGALVVAAALATLAQGIIGGTTWVLLVGLTATAVVLALLGSLADSGYGPGVASGLRSGGPRAHAPAVVHGVRAVHRSTGAAVVDGQRQSSVFVFDLTVVPDEGPAFRVAVRHPLDVQGLLHRTRAVVEYDPEQPWRVILPNDPPRPLLARAQLLDDEAAHGASRPARGLPPGAHPLVTGAILAALLTVLVRLAG
ncbi:hypothetical protein [Streptomyces kanamyceticus]|uniref:Uncharacterized protein n=1 Tax=Streptomyces kanamyceticus TaxID=1967 RepID=A0A5J6GQ00_STRKN|nr:hypothetical protein [Streptomyces kanamyceticus]QEU96095.1 hypothetical protein CP970_38830 [Streptomyces kanamyceticus]